MNFIRLLPIIISLLLLSAHFSKIGIFFLSLLLLILPFILFIKNKWVVTIIRYILVLGSLEWVRSLVEYVMLRQSIGEPYSRLIVILGVVALFTGLSILVFRNKSLKQRYNL